MDIWYEFIMKVVYSYLFYIYIINIYKSIIKICKMLGNSIIIKDNYFVFSNILLFSLLISYVEKMS